MGELRMPSLGAGMESGVLVAWKIAPGDRVKRGDIVAEVETEKGVIEIEVFEDGIVEELLVDAPAKLAVGAPMAQIGEGKRARAPAPSPPQAAARRRETPGARHLARELGLALETVRGTGPHETVTRADVVRVIERRAAEPSGPIANVPIEPRAQDVRRGPSIDAAPGRDGVEARAPARARVSPFARRRARELGVDIEYVSPGRDGAVHAADVERAGAPRVDHAAGMRRAIAAAMSASKRDIPHYYLAHPIDLYAAISFVQEKNERRPIEERLLVGAMLLKAVALAVREVPELNAHWIGDAAPPLPDVHLGVAVAMRGGGLVAPAIHRADRLSLDELMAAFRDLVERARRRVIRGSELTDATLTVTSLGERGVETVFPIINPPQVAMLGFGAIAERPWVVDGAVRPRPVVVATLAADHRASDGHRGALLLSAVARLLANPEDL